MHRTLTSASRTPSGRRATSPRAVRPAPPRSSSSTRSTTPVPASPTTPSRPRRAPESASSTASSMVRRFFGIGAKADVFSRAQSTERPLLPMVLPASTVVSCPPSSVSSVSLRSCLAGRQSHILPVYRGLYFGSSTFPASRATEQLCRHVRLAQARRPRRSPGQQLLRLVHARLGCHHRRRSRFLPARHHPPSHDDDFRREGPLQRFVLGFEAFEWV
jgi:hypothetical protein